MKKVIFAVKRLYSFISEFVVFDGDDPLIFLPCTGSGILLLCTHKSVARIYIIYIYKKIFS